MHRYRNSCRGYGAYGNMPAPNLTVNNITNVTNVTHVNVTKVKGCKPFAHHGRKHRGGKRERPPKLWRFASSCGLLDQDVVYRMDTGELMAESAKGIGYAARGLAKDVSDIGGGLCRAAGCVASGVLGVFEAFLDAWE